MALEFQGQTAELVGKFGIECKFPLLNLSPLCRDEVIDNLMVVFARWEDDTPQPLIIDHNSDVEILSPGDECEPATLNSEILTCSVILPNQKHISIQKPRQKYVDALRKFCRANGIHSGVTPFNSDGSLKAESPLSEPFLVYQLAEMRRGFMSYLRKIIMTGDSANEYEVDGILTQLRNGWKLGNQDGGCEFFRANVIDWGELTGAGAGVPAPPDAVIDAAFDEIVLNGYKYTGLTGLNLVEFFVLYMESMENFWFRGQGGVDQWTIWTPTGETNCIAELAACMQPCDDCPPNLLADPNIRERFAEFRNSKTVRLYPHDNPIPLWQSDALKDASPAGNSTMIFAPWMIEGEPTVALAFRDQDEQTRILSGELPWYGTELGLPSESELAMSGDVDVADEFESRAFSANLQREKNCIEVWIDTEFAIPVFAQHGYLVIDNVECAANSPIKSTDMSQAVTAAVAGATPEQLDITVAGLDVLAGDFVRVQFADGSVLFAEVVSYTDPNLVAEFSVDVTPPFGGGAVSVVKV